MPADEEQGGTSKRNNDGGDVDILSCGDLEFDRCRMKLSDDVISHADGCGCRRQPVQQAGGGLIDQTINCYSAIG